MGAPPGPVPAMLRSDADGGRAGGRGGSRGLGYASASGVRAADGQSDATAPPTAPESPAACGRTRKGQGRAARGFPEVGSAPTRLGPRLFLILFSPRPTKLPVRGGGHYALCPVLGWAPEFARGRPLALPCGSGGQSGLRKTAELSCAGPPNGDVTVVTFRGCCQESQEPSVPLQPARCSPSEEKGVGSFPGAFTRVFAPRLLCQ